jgi:NADPH:quinone reductase-like Zn-dependent oxidoreductase
MKALTVTRDDAPAIEMTEVEPPTPRPDEALIAVTAFSVNRGETFLLEREPAGWRPGKDISGTVVTACADGSGPAVGARVVAHIDAGGWAELVAVRRDRLVELPEGVSDADAATLPLAGLTALRLLRAAGPLYGRSVLLTGASGGVGHFFVELAAAQGALVTAVTASRKRGERLLELGAHAIVTDVQLARGPFEVVLDSVGGDTTQAAWRTLTPEGTFIWFGQASRTPSTLDFFDWTGGLNATLRKFHYLEPVDGIHEDLSTLVNLTAAGRLTPEIGFIDDWALTEKAIEHLLARRLRGHAVLTLTNRN